MLTFGRSEAQLTFNLPNPETCVAGESLSIDVTVENYDNLVAMQFSIAWDATLLDYVTIDNFHPNLETTPQVFTGNATNGSVNYNWSASLNDLADGIDIPDGETLFTISFTTTANTGTTNITVDDSGGPVEVEDNQGNIQNNIPVNGGNVIVGDTENPTIVCPENYMTDSPDGNPVQINDDLSATPMDNCSVESVTFSSTGATIFMSPSSGMNDITGQSFAVGTTTVTYEVTDGAGLSNTCQFDVVVNDVSSAIVVDIQDFIGGCGSTGNMIAMDVLVQNFDNVTGLFFQITYDPNLLTVEDPSDAHPLLSGISFNTNSPGTINVLWQHSDMTNGIFIDDDESLFTLNFTPNNATVDTSVDFNVSQISTGGNMPAEVTPIGGQVMILDGSNVGTADLNADATICTGESANLSVDISGGTAPYTVVYNDGNGDITLDDYQNNDPITVSPSTTTTYTLISVTDANGCDISIGNATATVTVNESPSDAMILGSTDTCPGDTTELTISFTGGTAPFTIIYTENIPGTTNTETITTNDNSVIFEVFPTISTIYSLESVTDANGCTANIVTPDAVVTASDENPPVFDFCPDDINQNVDAGGCAAIVTFPTPTATDDCDDMPVVFMTTSMNSGEEFPVGSSTVTFIAQDASNNNSIPCEFSVTITDNEPPEAVNCVPFLPSVTADQGECSAIIVFDKPYGTDNCMVVDSTASHVSGDELSVGTTNLVFTFTDASGLSTSCTTTITITDDEAPTITCPDDITMAASTTDCSAVVNWTPPTPMDNCPGATATNISTFDSGDALPFGATTITYNATDAAGNTASCDFVITVFDETAPEFTTCPTSQTIVVGTGETSAVVNDIEAIAFDNCGIDTLFYQLTGATMGEGPNDASGSTFNLGETTVTYTAEDVNGLIETCVFTITVNSDDQLSLTCPDNVIENNAIDACGLTVLNIEPMATPMSEVDMIVYELTGATIGAGSNDASGIFFNVGETTVTYTATNNDGEEFTCSFTVTINDTQNPTITCPTDEMITIDAGETSAVVENIAPATADNCGIDTTFYNLTGATTGEGANDASGTSFNVGETTVTYTTIDDSDSTATCSFTITVMNEEEFNLTCPDNQVEFSALDSCGLTVFDIAPTVEPISELDMIVYELTGATIGAGSNDASGIFFNVGTTTVTYTATDNDGMTYTCDFSIMINDTIQPTFTFCPSDTMNIPNDAGVCGAAFEYPTPMAMDDCSAIDTIICSTVSGEIFPVGTTTVTCTAVDVLGNMSEDCVFNVIVIDTENPTITCPTSQTVGVEMGETSAVVENIAPIVSDNCGIDTTFYNLNGATTGEGANDASGISFNLGETTVTYTTIDSSDSTAMCSFSVTVTDDSDLTLTCPENQVAFSPADTCGVIVENIAPTVTPMSALDTITYELTGATVGTGGNDASGIFYNIGTTTVIYTATDTSGNVINCSFSVMVNDTITPVIDNCPMDISINVAPNSCANTATWTAPTATDNCPNLNMTSTHDSGDEFMVGNTIVTYFAADASNNTAICTFTVTVTDNILPTIADCPEDVAATVPEGECSAIVTWAEPTISDNCPNPTLSSNQDSGDSFNVGETEVIYIGSDASGNQATCSFTVTLTDNENPEIMDCPDNIIVPAEGTDCTAVVTWDEPTATDNCANISLNGNPASGSIFQTGTTTVNYIATDASGNTAQCSFTVTVQDTENPTVTFCPPSMTEDADQNECSAIITWQEPTFEDNCGVTSVVANHDSGDTFPVNGLITVIYTASDASGNTATCEFTVEVIDNQMPVIFGIPEDIIVGNDAGACSAIVNYVAPQAFDNCGVASFNTSHPSGSEFPIGPTTVSYTASDMAGNVVVESFTITVEDNEPPKPVCPETVEITVDGTNLNDPSGNVISFGPVDCDSIFIELTEPTVTDNCQMATFEQTAGNEFTNGTPFPVGTTLMEYTAMDASGNESICAFNVIVNPIAFPAINLSSNFPCEGDDFMAQVEEYPNATFNWTSPNGEMVTGTSYSIPNIALTDEGIYTIEMVLPTCTMSQQFQLTVFETPEIEASANDILCTDGNQDLNLMATVQNGVTIDSWEWFFNGELVYTEQNPTIESATEDNAGEYIVRALTNNGCLSSDTITVIISTVAQMPMLTADQEATCVGAQINLTAQSYFGNAVEYVWSADPMTGSGLVTVNNFTTTATPTEAGTYTYSFFAIVDGCQTETAQTTVIVDAPPTLSPEVIGDLTCVDGTTMMTLQSNFTDANATYLWTFNNDFLSDQENVIVENISENNNGNYKIIVTLENGCQSEAALDIQITENPEMPDAIVGDNEVCLGEAVTLTGTNYGEENTTYIWLLNGAPVPNSNNSVVTFFPTELGNNVVSYSVNKDGCNTNTITFNLTVEAAPVANLAIDGETNCVDGTTPITLLSNNADAATSFWLNEANIQVASTPDFILENADASDSGNYYFVAESPIGCQNIDTINVQITDGLPKIAAGLIGQPCEDGNLRLTSTEIQNATYSWTSPMGNNFSSAQNPLLGLISPEFNGTYTVIASANGCTTTDSVAVEILTAPTAIDDEIPVITNTASEFNVLLNDGFDANQEVTVTILQSVTQGVLTDLGEGTFSYQPIEGSLETDMFAYQICYDACPSTCDIAFVELDVQFPRDNCTATTVITPNDDGINDRFVVFCLDVQDFPDNELVVFGSWGDEVFRMTGYDNSWKGTYENKPLPDGTYYYIFKRDPDAEPEKGFVMIYR